MNAGLAGVAGRWERAEELPAVRTITAGPRHHWFGYYDKLAFDPMGRYVLGMEVEFEHRSPKPDDIVYIGMVDLEDDDRWIELGRSTAWCWQQGCMLQWLPGSQTKVLWNDREGTSYVCRIRDVKTGALLWLSPGFAPRGCVNAAIANGRVFFPTAASGMIFCWEPEK